MANRGNVKKPKGFKKKVRTLVVEEKKSGSKSSKAGRGAKRR